MGLMGIEMAFDGVGSGYRSLIFFDMLAMDVMERFSLIEAITTFLHTTSRYISNDQREPRSAPRLSLRRTLFFSNTNNLTQSAKISPTKNYAGGSSARVVANLAHRATTQRITKDPDD